MWYQKTLTLSAKSRGFHLVTDEILNQLADMPRVNIGLLHLLLQHTSASLTLNENCDPTVRHDMERFFLRTVPDNGNYEHDYEGADDMPSHIKSSMLGTSLVLPVWICPYISRHLLSLNPLQARCRRYSRGER